MNKPAVTDKEIKEALIAANGQPTVAAKALNLAYPTLFCRIRKNPELGKIQKAARSRVFIELTQLTEFAIKTGFMRKHKLDDEGNMTNETELIPIDERTRMDSAFKMMAMFKGDEDIVDKVELIGTGSVDIDKWLKVNSETIEVDDNGSDEI